MHRRPRSRRVTHPNLIPRTPRWVCSDEYRRICSKGWARINIQRSVRSWRPVSGWSVGISAVSHRQFDECPGDSRYVIASQRSAQVRYRPSWSEEVCPPSPEERADTRSDDTGDPRGEQSRIIRPHTEYSCSRMTFVDRPVGADGFCCADRPTLLRFRWAGAAEVTMTPEHILRRFSVFPRSRCGSRGVSAVTPHRRTVEIAVRQLGTAPPYRRPPPVSPRRRRAHVNRPWTKRSESGSEAFTAPL